MRRTSIFGYYIKKTPSGRRLCCCYRTNGRGISFVARGGQVTLSLKVGVVARTRSQDKLLDGGSACAHTHGQRTLCDGETRNYCIPAQTATANVRIRERKFPLFRSNSWNSHKGEEESRPLASGNSGQASSLNAQHCCCMRVRCVLWCTRKSLTQE